MTYTNPAVTCDGCLEAMANAPTNEHGFPLMSIAYECGNLGRVEMGHQMCHTADGPTAACLLRPRTPESSAAATLGRLGGKADSPAQRAQRAAPKPGAGRPRVRQSLAQAVTLIRSGKGMRDVARCGLSGCPVGGWPETRQAMRRISEALPASDRRSYTVAQLVDAIYVVDAADRYQWRD